MSTVARAGDTEAFEALRRFDDTPGLDEFRFPGSGAPMWPFVRYGLFVAALIELDRVSAPYVATPPLSWREVLDYVATVVRRSPFRDFGRREVLLVGTGIGDVLRDGRWFNRLVDPFALATPGRSLVLERVHERRVKRPRAHGDVAYYDAIDLWGAVGTRLGRTPRAAGRAVGAFLEFLRARFPWSFGGASPWDDAAHALGFHAARLPWLESAVERVLDRVRPRLLIVEEASYGPLSYLVRAARRRGVATAEYQHGLVSRSHSAYNFGDAFARSPLRDGLPDHFLTYGEFWHDLVRTPSSCIAIGNPYLSESVAAARERASSLPSPSSVLVLGDGLSPEALSGFTLALGDLLRPRGLGVVFRPHPLERSAVASRYPELLSRGVPIDVGPLPEALTSSRAVVGPPSTTLYEALAFGKRAVALLTYELAARHLPPGLFPEAVDARGACDALLAASDGPIVASERIWKPGWRENYRAYVEAVIAARACERGARRG